MSFCLFSAALFSQHVHVNKVLGNRARISYQCKRIESEDPECDESGNIHESGNFCSSVNVVWVARSFPWWLYWSLRFCFLEDVAFFLGLEPSAALLFDAESLNHHLTLTTRGNVAVVMGVVRKCRNLIFTALNKTFSCSRINLYRI